MGALHELLPALNEAESIDKKMYDETLQLFGKSEAFEGYSKVLVMHDDARKEEEQGAYESRELITTVIDRLKYYQQSQVRNLDAQLQREVANTKATADVVVGEEVLLTAVPVTMLMYLEKYLVNFRRLIDAAPTYDCKLKWKPDGDSRFKGARVSVEPVKANKTERKKVPVELSPATKEHKAQVVLADEEAVVGHYAKTSFTGKWSPSEKRAAYEAIDTLIIAVKQAKARANKADINPVYCGDKLISYVMGAIALA